MKGEWIRLDKQTEGCPLVPMPPRPVLLEVVLPQLLSESGGECLWRKLDREPQRVGLHLRHLLPMQLWSEGMEESRRQSSFKGSGGNGKLV